MPANLVGDLGDSVLNDGKRLAHLIVLHILFVVQLVSELEQFVDFFLLLVLLLLFSYSPCRLIGLLASPLLRFIAWRLRHSLML